MANSRETVETVSDFTFGGSKITADGDCSHEIKTRLLLGRKAITNLDSLFPIFRKMPLKSTFSKFLFKVQEAALYFGLINLL